MICIGSRFEDLDTVLIDGMLHFLAFMRPVKSHKKNIKKIKIHMIFFSCQTTKLEFAMIDQV
jgi:hypothetical protein